ncbi:MAG: leucine-rich repeat protein [Ruminococcus sp.]|nr:leucine-rich repeat protein [Ruminococcus sp.]
MRIKQKVLSLISAAALAVQACPLAAYSSDDDLYNDWRFTNYYDSTGNMVVRDLVYFGSSDDIYVPEEIEGKPVIDIDMCEFLPKETEGDITIHIPDSIEVENEEYLAYMSSCDSVTVVRPSGKVSVYYPEKDKVWHEWPASESEWEYRILDGIEGVYDGKCVELLKYNGDFPSDVFVPAEIEGYPVARIGGKIYEDCDGGGQFHLKLPSSVLEYEYSYEDEFGYDLKLLGTNVSYPEIQIGEGCLDCNAKLSLEISPYRHYHKKEGFTEDVIDFYGQEIRDGQWEAEYNHVVMYDLEKNTEDKTDKWWSVTSMVDYAGKDFDIPAYIAGYPVREIKKDSYYNFYSEQLVNIRLPDTIDVIAPYAFYDFEINSINIPKSVEVLPEGVFNIDHMPMQITGLKDVPFVSSELFMNDKLTSNCYYEKSDINRSYSYYFQSWEQFVNSDDLLFFNYSCSAVKSNDIFKPFMMTDQKTGYTYEAKIDKNDHKVSLDIIYMPDPTDEVPTEFRGYPVNNALLEYKPLGAKVVTPESATLFTKNDMLYYVKQVDGLIFDYIPWRGKDFYELQEKESDEQSKYTKEVIIKSKDLHVVSDAFRQADLKTLEFPGSVDIDAGALENLTNLEKLTFSGEDSYISLKDSAAARLLNLKEIVFPEKCKELYIDARAFSQNQCRTITLPEGTVFIGKTAFSRSRIRELTINGSPEIDHLAFYSCTDLKTLTINGEPKIEDDAFENCVDLEDLHIDLSQKINGNIFTDLKKLSYLNGEDIFDEDGNIKKECADFIERNLANVDECGLVNKYVKYLVKKTVNEVVSDDMSDIEKIKAIHDKICHMVTYDTDNVPDKKNHTDISVFVNDSSVCEGYARAMNLMLHEAGFESSYVYSEDHAWVIVKVGDHYFHVDPTWDDGNVINYEWFMKTDDELKNKESHEEWSLGRPSSLHDFQSLKMPSCTDRMGDVNTDGIVDGRDASMILKAYAQASLGDETDIDTVLADFDFNGNIDARDASAILTAYAKNSAEDKK